jgi:methyl-accepting chemotaxis protein
MRIRPYQNCVWSRRNVMRIFSGMSIRLVLGLIIGALGVLLVALSTGGLFVAAEQATAARRVVSLTAVSQQLFVTFIGARLERGIINAGLFSETPTDAVVDINIANNRQTSETGFGVVVERLTGTADPKLAPFFSDLTSAHKSLSMQRTGADAAVHLPRQSRDPSVAQDYRTAAQTYLDAILALTSQIEASLKLVDPVVDQFLMVKQSAWATRNYRGLVTARIEHAAAAGKSWSPADIVGAAQDSGRAAQGWDQVIDAAARRDAPQAIVDAVARSSDAAATALVNRQLEVIRVLSSGQKTEVPLADLQKLDNAILTTSVDVASAALDAMVARAGRQMENATESLILDGIMMILALGVTALGFAIVYWRVSMPIRRLTKVMRRLADHDLSVALEETNRADEIGDMSRAVEIFKKNMITADRLAGEQRVEQARKEQRQIAIDSFISTFDQAVTESLRTLALASTELNATAQSMSATAAETSNKSMAVAAASEEASVNVQTVAAATEQLSASINEISRQVADSTSVAREAVAQAKRTDDEVQALADSAKRIGDVVKLINGIAGQTNLLALNATIEAAGAGEAGRGFAVVASEVKSLATQTARATDDIATQISAIQGATGSAVHAIRAIGETIERVNQIAAAIAAAVEQQGAATREIARSVQQASAGTAEVSSHIVEVSKTASQTGTAAGEVLDSAQSLARLSEALRLNVDRFVSDIRTA